METLLLTEHVNTGNGLMQDNGVGGLEFTGIGSFRLDACKTAEIARTTFGSLVGMSPHVTHVERAAVIAPC